MANDFKTVKQSLEGQMKDLERIYLEELKYNTQLMKKNEQMNNLVISDSHFY